DSTKLGIHQSLRKTRNGSLARFADLYDTGQIPEYHDVVDKIIAWGQEILAYHPSRRATNGPLEGINNLLQVLRRVAHGFTMRV
ncbi:MAG: transposase, partial [bacterium]|nr:transposase [bacterium]MDE0352849.1 transposase [bacterium]